MYDIPLVALMYFLCDLPSVGDTLLNFHLESLFLFVLLFGIKIIYFFSHVVYLWGCNYYAICTGLMFIILGFKWNKQTNTCDRTSQSWNCFYCQNIKLCRMPKNICYLVTKKHAWGTAASTINGLTSCPNNSKPHMAIHAHVGTLYPTIIGTYTMLMRPEIALRYIRALLQLLVTNACWYG